MAPSWALYWQWRRIMTSFASSSALPRSQSRSTSATASLTPTACSPGTRKQPDRAGEGSRRLREEPALSAAVSSEQPPPADKALIELLNGRDGRKTTVVLVDGRRFDLWNIAWGYDMGDEFAHVTTNCSPFVEGTRLDVFFTNEVAVVLDERGEPVSGLGAAPRREELATSSPKGSSPRRVDVRKNLHEFDRSESLCVVTLEDPLSREAKQSLGLLANSQSECAQASVRINEVGLVPRPSDHVGHGIHGRSRLGHC